MDFGELGKKRSVVVIAGPSGSGKNTVINHLLQNNHNCAKLVTATTRLKRPGEIDGVDYHFLSQEKFDDAMRHGMIPEHRFVPGLNTYYGIYLPDLEQKLAAGKVVLAAVDIEGAKLLKARYEAVTIFIMPESLDEFRGRLRVRNPEWSQKEFDTRMKITEREVKIDSQWYDHRVINANGLLHRTIAQVVEILQKEGYNLA